MQPGGYGLASRYIDRILCTNSNGLFTACLLGLAIAVLGTGYSANHGHPTPRSLCNFIANWPTRTINNVSSVFTAPQI